MMIPAICISGEMFNKSVSIYQTSRQGDRLTSVEVKAAAEQNVTRTLELDPAKTYQTLIGIGSSFTESSAYVLSELSVEARDKVLEACRRHEKAAGLHIVLPSAQAIKKALADGFTFLCIGSDMIGLNEVARSYRKTAIEAAKEG